MMSRRSIELCTIGALIVGFALVAAFADAGLIPGGGPAKSDCYAELSIDGITNPSDRVKANGKQVLLTDGESGDSGPCGDNKCTVRVGVCINQKDPNLSDCKAPASLDTLDVKGALSITKPALLTGSACGAFITGDIEAKVKTNKDGTVNIKKSKPGKIKVKVKGKGPKGTKPRTDSDNVLIQCVVRTVACPVTTTTTTTLPASPSGAFVE